MDKPHDPWVPKTHPLDRDMAEADPLELMAEPAVGDPVVMLECLVQDFIWMGWSLGEVLSVFGHPNHPVLGELARYFGPNETEQRVRQMFAKIGQWSFREFVAEPDESDEHDDSPQLVQIQLPTDPTTCR